MPTVDVDGARIHYDRAGDGPAVVLVHGAGGNSLIWWQQVPTFAREHCVIAVDQRGFGRSACTPDTLHPRYFASDLAAVLDDAGIDRAALVCQSMGGWTGLRFAIRHPERTRLLVLCGTPGGVATDRIVRDMAAVGPKAAKRGVAGMALAPDFPAREPERARLYEQLSGLNPPETMATLMPALAGVSVSADDLAGYSVPTRLLVGTEDAFFSVDGLREVAAAIPGAELQVLSGLGHSTYFEAPAEFNRIILDLLKEHV